MRIDVDRWTDQINRSSPVPLYAQLGRIIESHLDQYRAGDVLPNEDTLVSRFRVSGPTVRRALSGLLTDGVIIRQRGVGAVLARTKTKPSATLHLDPRRGFTTTVTAGSVEIETGPAGDRRNLSGPAVGTSSVWLEHATRDGVRIAVCRSWSPDRRMAGISKEAGQDELLDRIADLTGEQPAIAELTVRTERAASLDLTDLELGPGSPVLVVETTWRSAGRVVLQSHARWRGDTVCVDFPTGVDELTGRSRSATVPASARVEPAGPPAERPTVTLEEIARRAGVSIATVDRVLHERPGVRPATAQRVHSAIKAETVRHRPPPPTNITIGASLGNDWRGAALGDELRQRVDTVAPRHRIRLQPIDPAGDLLAQLRDVRARGLIVRAPDTPDAVDAVETVVQAGISVVTVGSDLPTTHRLGFAGADGIAAGETIARSMIAAAPQVLTVLVLTPDLGFRLDEEIEQGFRQAARSAGMRVVDVSSRGRSGGAARRTRLAAAVAAEPAIDAVFAIGPGTSEALDVLAGRRARPRWRGAWGRSPDHLTLLREGHLDLLADTRPSIEAVRALRLLTATDTTPPALPPRPVVEFDLRDPTFWPAAAPGTGGDDLRVRRTRR